MVILVDGGRKTSAWQPVHYLPKDEKFILMFNKSSSHRTKVDSGIQSIAQCPAHLLQYLLN